MKIFPDGGNCESIVEVEAMMGPLSSKETASLRMRDRQKTVLDHWRVKLALKVCDNCPLSIFRNCEQQFFDEPGIRAGQYLSRADLRAGKIREVTSWESGNSETTPTAA